jgi:undecaprenyl-diphosphatase
MIEALQAADTAILLFINRTLSTPLGDFLWPLITDYDKLLPVRIVLIGIWLYLLVKGGTRGRTVALLLLPVILLADQLSSSVIKILVDRPRPCHLIGGLPAMPVPAMPVPAVPGIHLLVDCGSGKSFPSSHAVNNFAVAVLISRYYPRGRWALFAWAALVALSRPAVGVHYPSDIVGGALLGTAVSLAVIAGWTVVQRRFFPRMAIDTQAHTSQ